MRENVRAQLRVIVKRILRKYSYPPDKQEKATQTMLEQTALSAHEWAVALLTYFPSPEIIDVASIYFVCPRR